jgi:uncharacterized membrane protein (DUF4010 family)
MISDPTFPPIDISIELAIATGIGLLVGLEREWSQKELGSRTFTITALIGMLSVFVTPAATAAAFIGILLVVLIAALHTLREGKPPETTTSAALILTFVLGLLVGQGHHYTPVAVAIVMTLVLGAKPTLTHFAGGLTEKEIRGAVLLGLLAFVIYPVLPNNPIDPWQLVNLREAWLTVILIAVLGFVNYVLLKVYHAKGLYYTAILGGMVNSTAAIAELAGFFKNPEYDMVATASIINLLTIVAMFLRNLMILGIFARQSVLEAAGPLAAMATVSLIFIWKHQRQSRTQIAKLELSSPLSLSKVGKFGVLFLVISVLGSLGQRYFGASGFLIVSVIGGLVSSASTTGAAATLAMHGKISAQSAAFATVLTSMTSALSNLPIIHQQARNWSLTRQLTLVSVAIVAVGVLTMIVAQFVP